MKPWEGKHWLQIIENYSGNEPNLCMFNSGIHNAILNLTEALKKDWEEQQKEEDDYTCPLPRKTYKAKLIIGKEACAQTAEKEKNGHQESYRIQSFLKPERENRLIKNLMMTISMQRDEMDELKRKFHDEKKAESCTLANWIVPPDFPKEEQEIYFIAKDGITDEKLGIAIPESKIVLLKITDISFDELKCWYPLPNPPGDE